MCCFSLISSGEMDPSNTSLTANIIGGTGDPNQTDNTGCLLESDDWTFSVLPVYIMTVSVLGIVFNVFVLMVFCLHKKSCTTAEIYLSNLAAADLVLVSFLPFWAFYVSKRFNWTFGLGMCKLVNVNIRMNFFCGIYFLVLVSIDRYLALVHPMSSDGIRRPKFAKLGCVLVWILGFLFSLPELLYRELMPSENNRTQCTVNFPNSTIELTSEFSISVFGLIVPIIIISFCTINIIKSLKNRLTKGVNAKKTDHKATTLILAVLLAFLICWVPFHLIKLLYILIGAGRLTGCSFLKVLYTCRHIATYFAFFNSVLNPILYVIVGKTFQKKVRELFRQWDHKRTSTISNTLSTKLSRSVRSQHKTI